MRRICALHALGSVRDLSVASPSSDLPRLLLVERDETMRAILPKTLSTHYRVEAASDGLEACRAAKLRPPASLLIDLSIPGTDNLTLIRAMRADALTARIPIIILTASLHKELLLRCLAAGATNFLLKPFNTAELLMCIQVELDLRGPCAESSR